MKHNYFVIMKLPQYIIAFGIGAAFGYFFRIPPAFESIFFGSISVGTILGLIGLFRDLSKEKKEKKLDHSKWLFKQILNLPIRLPMFIGLADNQTPDLSINVGSPYNEYVTAHLESGYKEVWKYRKERDSLISSYNANAPLFLDRVVEKIINEIKKKIPSIIEWDITGQPPPKYFTRHLKPHVGSIIYNSYERDIDLNSDFPIISERNNRWKIFMGNVLVDLVENDNENDIQEIKQMIKAILEEALRSQDYKGIKSCYEEIKAKHRQFESGVDEIIKNVENNNPVKGHCKFCP